MSTKNTENAIDFAVVVNIIQPALRRLYNMPGAGLDFKLRLKTLRDEVDGKVFQVFSPVREAMKKKEIAGNENQMAEAEQILTQQYQLAEKAKISIDSPKIPKSLLPDEKGVLSQRWNETSTDGQKQLHGDYVTEVVNIYEYLIDAEK
ncbi:hypothetical protein [Runella sp. SP2]|uniref:hypothetical protein n=1 Tax=Runella sp. SP2 TaxID=2268026 RepID=UPI000F07B63B|nr:hypothetical protein [Runella sp. SP2]AYQ31380.1 hypothetical protein DTQ70_03945 [Runella sp. SP2]